MDNDGRDTKFPGWELFKKIQVITVGEEQKVLLEGRPYLSWAYKDRAAPRLAITQLYKSGLATQEELAEAFGIHGNSIYNYTTTFERDGVAGLLGQQPGPKEPWKITPDLRFTILEVAFANKSISYQNIADLVKKRWDREINIRAIRRVLVENGLVNLPAKKQLQESLMDLFERRERQLQLWDLNNPRQVSPATEDISEQVDQNQMEQVNETALDENFENRKLSCYSPNL